MAFMIELGAAFFIVFFTFAPGYFYLLENPIKKYHSAMKQKQIATLENIKAKLLIAKDLKTQKLLLNWQKKNLLFYTAMQVAETPDQLLQLLTQTAQQSGFTIIQAAPIKNEARHHTNPGDYFNLQLSGNYADLFHFIDQLNNTAFPFSLSHLKINDQKQYGLLIKVNEQ